MFHLLSIRSFLKKIKKTGAACSLDTGLVSVNAEVACYVTSVNWFTVDLDVHASIGGPYIYSVRVPLSYIDSVMVNPIEDERDKLMNRADLHDLSLLEE